MSQPKKNDRRPLPVLSEEDPRGPEVQAWLTLARVYHLLERRLGAGLGGGGLSLSQFDVLATLYHGEGITQQELAERLLVTKGNIVGLLDRVCAWVERRPDPNDRRANRLYLTPAGRKLMAKVLPGHLAAVREVMGGLSAAELEALNDLLSRLEGSVAD